MSAADDLDTLTEPTLLPAGRGTKFPGMRNQAPAIGDCSLCNRPRLLDVAAGGCSCVFVESLDLEELGHERVRRRARREAAIDALLATAGLLAFTLALLAGWAILAGL